MGLCRRSEDAKHDAKRQRESMSGCSMNVLSGIGCPGVEDPEKANPRFRGEKEDKANDSE